MRVINYGKNFTYEMGNMNIENENWHKQRAEGIGGSDAAVIMGVSPWKSKLELWTEKVEGVRIEKDSNILQWGKILEPEIMKQYMFQTGRNVVDGSAANPLKSSHFDYLIGNVDGIIIESEKNPQDGPGVLEIKTKQAYAKWESDWKEGNIPLYYKCQLQHYLMVTGFAWGSFAILDFANMELVCLDFERDDDLINDLIHAEVDFWNKVENKIRPEPDSSKSCNTFLREYYKDSEEDTIDLTNDQNALEWGHRLSYAKNLIKKGKDLETEAINHLMDIMEHYEKATGDNFTISWRSPKPRDVFDMDLFKSDYPELYKKYMKKISQTRRFVFRELKK